MDQERDQDKKDHRIDCSTRMEIGEASYKKKRLQTKQKFA